MASAMVLKMPPTEGSRLKVLSWNCRGLRNKLDRIEQFLDHDILFMYEAMTDEESDVCIEGYKNWNFHRKYRHEKAKSNSGGVVLYVKESIVEGIDFVRDDFDTIIWIKLDKAFFNLKKDIYICGLYIWKEKSPMDKQIANSEKLFLTLRQRIDQYKDLGNVFIVGDFNGRIGYKEDRRFMAKYLKNQTLTRSLIPERSRMDKVSNSQGQRMLMEEKDRTIR